MLKTFRDNLKHFHWVLWLVVIAFIAIEFSVFGNRSMEGPAGPATTAATVGKDKITFGEFQTAYNNLSERYRQIYGDAFNEELAQQIGLPRQAIDGLIAESIQLEEARRMGLHPTDDEVRKAILEIPGLTDANGNFIGIEEYRARLDSARISEEDLVDDLRRSLLLTRLQAVLASTVYVPDQLVEKEARESAEQANIQYVQLSGAAVASDVVVTDADISSWFEEKSEDYRLPAQRSAGYLSVNVNQIRAGIQVPEEDLRAYYDSNQAEFEQQEQVRARQIMLFADGDRSPESARAELESVKSQLESGADFSALAQELSEDPVSKQRGGDLGQFARGNYPPAFEEAVFGAEVGTLVGPFDNTLGTRNVVHLVEIQSKVEGGVQPFETVRNRIDVRLLNERARQQAEDRAREIFAGLEGQTPGTEADLTTLAQAEGVTFETTPPFGRDENVPNIGRGTEFATSVFALEQNTYGEPVRVPSGWSIPVVLSVLEPRLPELEEVREQVRADVVTARQEDLALERLQTVASRLEEGATTLTEIATELGVTAQDSGLFGRRAPIPGLGRLPEISNAALDLEEGGIGGPFKSSGGAVVFQVTERQRFDLAEFEATTKETTRQRLEATRVNSLLQALIEERRSELEVSYSREFVETFEVVDAPAGG